MIGRKTKGITRLKKLSAYQVLEILFPVAFHYGMMLLAAMLTGNFLDAASQTTLAALLALPFLWMLYKKEPKPEKKYSRRSLWLLPFVGMAGNTLFSLILNAVHLTEHFSNASQEALFQSNLLLQIIGIGLFVPFVEELVFWPGPTNAGEVFQRRCSFTSEPIFLEFWRR